MAVENAWVVVVSLRWRMVAANSVESYRIAHYRRFLRPNMECAHAAKNGEKYSNINKAWQELKRVPRAQIPLSTLLGCIKQGSGWPRSTRMVEARDFQLQVNFESGFEL